MIANKNDVASCENIFDPYVSLDKLASFKQVELNKVNKQSQYNLMMKCLKHPDSDFKLRSIDVFKNCLMIGPNFHFENKNRNMVLAIKEVLTVFQDHPGLVKDNHQAV